MKILIVQPDLLWEQPAENRSHIAEMIAENDRSVNLILLPELFTTGFTMNVKQFAEDLDGETSRWMLGIAKKYNAVITGSIIVKDESKIFNRLLWCKPDGTTSYYNKRHLFRMGNENNHYNFGQQQLIVKHNNCSIMPLICYDLRFPVWSRNKSFYDILSYHSNWPAPRNEVWESLLKARAIENQAYVIGVNRIGRDGEGIEYIGNSLVFDPKGKLILQIPNHEAAEFVELDIDKLRRFRQKFPVWKDMDRFELK